MKIDPRLIRRTHLNTEGAYVAHATRGRGVIAKIPRTVCPECGRYRRSREHQAHVRARDPGVRDA